MIRPELARMPPADWPRNTPMVATVAIANSVAETSSRNRRGVLRFFLALRVSAAAAMRASSQAKA
ncbi:Uncharacterised protein [Bordetella pertussis]|nr:Uncharacterised protein [Bordetella pertussis]CFO36871.1 Uncharacterised protein [Bordetella pertussis]CFP11557.1 Uncharacterised protein [Bordetella pertussis]CPM05961.1 Uncharacterised protein [Bordetella pertussis]CPP52051.1 Uncharacterised protein [Bordetella pertussis]